MSESVFDLPETLESINGGCSRYDMSQMYPLSGAINGAVVGAGAASGLTTFQWQDSNWWSPCQSYFYMRCTFTQNAVAPVAQNTAYADNFAMTLFSQISTQINSRPLDTVNTPWLIDTALTYANSHNSFLKSSGSLTRVGESLTTRIRNLQSNGGIVEVVFRPPVSIFDVKLLPPGAQYTLGFNWAANGLNAFEACDTSLLWGTSAVANNVSISINEFSFYKATVSPDHFVNLPERGVIDLSPCMALQYIITNSNTLKQNISIPSTTNKILLGFQDTNTTPTVTTPNNTTCGVGNGYNPATSFANTFTNVVTNDPLSTNIASLSTLWLDLPELGIQEPKPVYNFSSGITDYMRAYSDFCHVTQGTKTNEEGSVPFGSMAVGGTISGAGVTIIAPSTSGTGTAFQLGDLNNPQQLPYIAAGSANVPQATVFNKTAKWGWLGRCPGPIFAFPVVRPQGKYVTTGTLNATFSGSPAAASITATIIASYSMALVCTKQPNGYYSIDVVEGV